MYEDLLEDSWVYQEILQKGMGRGLQQGAERERALEARRLRQTLYTILQSRFPNLVQKPHALVERATQPEVLQALIVKVSIAHTAQEAQQALDALDS